MLSFLAVGLLVFARNVHCMYVRRADASRRGVTSGGGGGRSVENHRSGEARQARPPGAPCGQSKGHGRGAQASVCSIPEGLGARFSIQVGLTQGRVLFFSTNVLQLSAVYIRPRGTGVGVFFSVLKRIQANFCPIYENLGRPSFCFVWIHISFRQPHVCS